ncbi:hypothetical protein D187_008416 [Cystobacter fuscus DSM 2262]|uniref:Uncharacterized protein n=1 Tax=Cystobacter fuscus (strain ATCC 25194 / DSM 2262 / NBRC 100088 / M29) TaxID=1242864 RepID=S9QLT2_CYSF2|nr:hypothetical protein D187_008416 [Cystobacter fuscus DSM 2262]
MPSWRMETIRHRQASSPPWIPRRAECVRAQTLRLIAAPAAARRGAPGCEAVHFPGVNGFTDEGRQAWDGASRNREGGFGLRGGSRPGVTDPGRWAPRLGLTSLFPRAGGHAGFLRGPFLDAERYRGAGLGFSGGPTASR